MSQHAQRSPCFQLAGPLLLSIGEALGPPSLPIHCYLLRPSWHHLLQTSSLAFLRPL